jgi:peptidoglycan/LPS O-acetylase OafA/YrhL
MQKRFEALTGIRAVAAIMVFLYHNKKYWRDWLPEMVIRNLNEFNAGVSIFFVLSGFLIAYTYQQKPLDSSKSYLQYLLTRFARIYPIFFILLTIQFLDYGFPKEGVNIWYDYSLIKGFSDVFNLDGIPQSWSLTVELSFYILAPFITYLLFKNKWLALAILTLLCCLVIGIGYWCKYINGNSNRWLYNWWFVMDGSFFGRFFEFYVGMYLAKLLLANADSTTPLSKLPKTWIGFVGTFVVIYCISFF